MGLDRSEGAVKYEGKFPDHPEDRTWFCQVPTNVEQRGPEDYHRPSHPNNVVLIRRPAGPDDSLLDGTGA